MPRIGSGVQEIRIRDAAGAFRVIYYVAKFADPVYVLHCFKEEDTKDEQDRCGPGREALARLDEGDWSNEQEPICQRTCLVWMPSSTWRQRQAYALR
jgi:hypothetical protein